MGAFTHMRKIICENSYGYKLEFAYSFPFFLSDYKGIHEYSGSVATVKSAFGIGVSYIGTSVNKRNITLVIAIKDDDKMQIRKNQLYNIFPLQNKGTLYYHEGEIVRKINYYVESVDFSRNANVIYYSISLICPSPYFEDSEETIATLKNWDKLIEFPIEIEDEVGIEFGSKNESTTIEIDNNSHIDFGLTITLQASSKVVNPSIKNLSSNEILKLNYTMEAGDTIIISTYNNEKNITLISANDEEKNITNSLVFGTKFLQAKNGSNRFVVDAESGVGNLELQIAYSNYYEAV